MTDNQKNLIILNALMLKTQGIVPSRTPFGVPGILVSDADIIYIDETWVGVDKAATDLDIAYKVFSTDAGLKACVTKDVEGTAVRLTFGIQHDGTEASVILQRIVELYVRVQLWVLNPKVQIPGWDDMNDALFG